MSAWSRGCISDRGVMINSLQNVMPNTEQSASVRDDGEVFSNRVDGSYLQSLAGLHKGVRGLDALLC